MLLLELIKPLDPLRFTYTGQVRTFHAFADLSEIKTSFEQVELKRKFLPGLFTIEFGEKRFRERLESPEAMALRVRKQMAADASIRN